MEFSNEMTVELIQCSATDEMVAMAAWVSNGLDTEDRLKNKDRVRGLIKYLYSHQHNSPFEHGQFTFKVSCPIFVAREFMRHRTFSFNEVSGRYKELEPKFYVVPHDRPLIQHGKVGAYTFEEGSEGQVDYAQTATKVSYESAWGNYQNMIRAGIAREVARNVLPVGIYTQFYASVNPRNLMHFLDLRNAPQALREIRVVAEAMELILEAQMPLTYEAYKETNATN